MSIEIEDIKKVNLAEGDVLIIKVDHPDLRVKQRAAIGEHFQVVFPDNKILVLDRGFSLGVLTKKDIDEM